MPTIHLAKAGGGTKYTGSKLYYLEGIAAYIEDRIDRTAVNIHY